MASKVLSLFSNIGVAEAYLHEIGFQVVVANEIDKRRAKLYSQIYPQTYMINGDINDINVYNEILEKSKSYGVDIILATPPCQGMSTAGQQTEFDERNKLIIPVIKLTQLLQPKYVFIENVPMIYNTYIKINDENVLIYDYICRELSSEYIINKYIIDTKNYSVPQTRERAIMLLTKKGNKVWEMPNQDKKIISMREAIGDLPSLDPFIKDISREELLSIFPRYEEKKEKGLKISKWHTPPCHIKRQVIVMQHTPTGQTAFDNLIFKPIKENGQPVKGYHNTYKRQNWDTPAYTVTMDNRKISSQNNVHPGRVEKIMDNGQIIYSDARVLTLYEIMIISSIPSNWNIPENTSEAFLRRIIGEGIPPLFVKKVFEKIREV